MTNGKRRRGASSPTASHPPTIDTAIAPQPQKPTARIPRGGRRGAALLRAAGVTDPPAANGDLIASPGDTSFTRGDLKRKASAPENNNTVPKDPLEKQCLPAKLSALEEIFMAVTTVYEMLRRRGKRTTFSNMKAAVEEASGRRFMESHLSQLQVLLPEVITLETISLPVAPHSKRLAANIVVTFTGNDQPASLRAQLHVRLARHLLESYAMFLRTEARELRALGNIDAAEALEGEIQRAAPITQCIEQFRLPFPHAVPDVMDTSRCGAASVASPLPVDNAACMTASASVGGVEVSTEGLAQATSASVPGPRRLSFSDSFAPSEDASFLITMPEELRRRSLDGIISANSLRVLQGNEQEHRRLSSSAAHTARDARAALGALPTTFSRLRRIFGPQGTSAMKLDDVVQRVRGGGAGAASTAEVVSQLRCLEEHAPECIELKPWGTCGTPAVWINRKCDWNAVAMKLKGIAAARRQSTMIAASGETLKKT